MALVSSRFANSQLGRLISCTNVEKAWLSIKKPIIAPQRVGSMGKTSPKLEFLTSKQCFSSIIMLCMNIIHAAADFATPFPRTQSVAFSQP